MKIIRRFSCVSAFVLLLASCAEEQTESYTKFEKIALEAWITQHRPQLINNYQPDGGYYVDVLEAGDMAAAPVSDTACWVQFDFSGRDLAGNIVLTRNATEARQLKTFTRYTHYVPFYRYYGDYNSGLLEGTYLAMRNTLQLDKEYADARGLPTELKLREGSKVVLYMPSSVVGSVSGSGGYEGQSDFALDGNRPFIVTMEIRDTVKNPLEREGTEVDAFCRLDANGGLKVYNKSEEDPDTEPLPSDPKDENHPYNVDARWVSVNDTIPQVYVNYRFDPTKEKITFPTPYASPYEPYNNFPKVEEEIRKALAERFHPDEEDPYKGVVALEADSVKLDGTAKIWYIARFLDGFIIDTNIDEVKQIVYGEVKSTGSAESYKPSAGGKVTAWYYTVPNLKYGQWAALVTTSTNAYGSVGVTGTTSTSPSNTGYSSSYLDYINLLNYTNSYYGGNGYYGGYYGDYYGGYGGYGGGYYNPYYGYGSGYDTGSGSGSETTGKVTVTTEVPPFTPLLFELYIEPQDK